MRNQPNFSGKLLHLDRSVWLVMGITLLVSVLLLAFKSLGKPGCAALLVTVDGRQETGVAVRRPGRLIQFAINTTSGPVKWRFGDGTAEEQGNRAMHRFVRAGNYRVVARTSGGCTYEQFIAVRNLSFAEQNTSIEIDILEDPVKPKAGDQVHFYGVTNVAAKRYEWRLLGTGDSAQYGTVAQFHFPDPGTYRVQLKLDNDPNKVRVKIVTIQAEMPVGSLPGGGSGDLGGMPPVLDGIGTDVVKSDIKPNVPVVDPEKLAADDSKSIKKAIDPATFKDQLVEVIAGNKEISELNAYLDYGESTKVQEEGKTLLVNIGPFCRDMMRRKGAKIEQVQFSLDDKKAIQIIRVKVQEQKKKKGFLGGLFGGKDK